MTGRRASGAGEGGFALIAVLLAGGFLALLVATMSRAAHTEGAVSRNLTLAAQAREAADGAVRSTIFDLLTDADSAAPPDGSARSIVIDGIEVSLAVQDVAGLVDLNTAPPELLLSLLVTETRSSPLANDLAAAILQRRGSPSSASGAAKIPARPFRSAAELAAIAGMPVELYHRLLGLVTVTSRQPGIDPHTAPAEILLSLPGIDPQRAADTIAARLLDPDAPRQLLATAVKYLADSPRDAVQIVAIATVSGIVAERRALVRLTRGAVPPYRVLEWQAGLI